jgi:uncharacterized protein YjbJ (UPF0337 family)
MDWTSVQSDWDQYRDKVKARWAKLSATHLDAIAGDRVRLSGMVREVYKISSDEAERQIRYFEERNHDYRPQSSSCSKWRRVSVSTADRPQK